MTDTSAEAVERELSLLACRRAGAGGCDTVWDLWAERTERLIRALVAEREEDQGVIAVWRRRAEQAEAKRDAARAEAARLRDTAPTSDDGDAITAEDEDRAFLGFSDEDDDE